MTAGNTSITTLLSLQVLLLCCVVASFVWWDQRGDDEVVLSEEQGSRRGPGQAAWCRILFWPFRRHRAPTNQDNSGRATPPAVGEYNISLQLRPRAAAAAPAQKQQHAPLSAATTIAALEACWRIIRAHNARDIDEPHRQLRPWQDDVSPAGLPGDVPLCVCSSPPPRVRPTAAGEVLPDAPKPRVPKRPHCCAPAIGHAPVSGRMPPQKTKKNLVTAGPAPTCVCAAVASRLPARSADKRSRRHRVPAVKRGELTCSQAGG